MSGVSTPSLRLSSTMTLTVPPNRRNACSWSSAQICAPDRHGNQLTIWLTGAGTRGSARRWRTQRVGGHPRGRNGRFWLEVGGHLLGNGRFWFGFATSAAPVHRDAGGLQIATNRLATDS